MSGEDQYPKSGTPAGAAAGGTFEEAWSRAAEVPGWLTQAQARRLWDETFSLGQGSHVVEIGSHQGRSTLVLAAALCSHGQGGRLTAVDAFMTGPRYGGHLARVALERTLRVAGLEGPVSIVANRSSEVRGTWQQPVDLVWVDGKHDFWTCSDDLKWSRHLPSGGHMLVHDAFSSIGVTTALLVHVFPSRRLRLIDRVDSLATLEVGPPDWGDRLRFLRQLPWWFRNIVVKVLLRLRMRSLTRLLGHRGPDDPY